MGLTITTFSAPCIRDAAGESVAFPEKAILAIAYLLTRTPARISRTGLAEFLWGDGEEGDPLANLRQLMARTRQKQERLGVALLVSRGQEIVLDTANLNSDLIDLSKVCDDPIQSLRVYLSIFTGEFLEGCRTASARAALWLEAERSRHLALLHEALEAAISLENARAHAAVIREAGYRLLTLDPYNDGAYRSLLALYALIGDEAQARILTLRYQDMLRDELGLALVPPAGKGVAAEARTDLPKGNGEPPQTGAPRHHLPRLLVVPPNLIAHQDGRLYSALLEDITIGLCRARSISVVAPHTARRIAIAADARVEAYARHSIAYALETKLSIQGSTPMLFASLADVTGDRFVWAERFEVSDNRLNDVYREIVHRIVATTAEKIELQEFRKIGMASPADAYQYYLLGQHHLRKIDLPNLRRARKFFRSALQEAPDLSNALSGLSRAEHLEWLVTARGDKELLRSAQLHAEAAIETDAANAGGYHQLGVVRLYNGAFDDSLTEFAKAEHLAPCHADLIADYADTLVHASEPDKALAKIERAIDLNPLCPDVYWWTAAGANYCLGRFENALAHIARMDDSSATTRLEAACWGMLGDRRQARRLVRRTMETYPDFEVEKWLSIMPVKEDWQKQQYREGLLKAGFQ